MMINETYYTIYKTTNNINSKVYIGKHITTDLRDGYLGSGNVLKSAISKYGRHNFTKKYLYIFDNEEDMNNKEQFLVNEAFIKSRRTYNVALGGKGGCIVLKPEHPLYEDTCKKLQQANLKRSNQLSKDAKKNHEKQIIGMHNKKHSVETKEKISKATKGRVKTKESIEKHRKSLMKTLSDPDYVNPLKGRVLSKETTDKISANHACVKGKNNPMYGKAHKEQTVAKISEAIKNKPKISCEYCNTAASPGNYKRWHGDNCKRSKSRAVETT